jgi:hypothetical protein
MDPTLWAVTILVCALVAAQCWTTWLYLMEFKRVRMLEVDNYRLMRTLGRFHGVSLGTPQEFPMPDSDPSPIPPFFRMKRPTKPEVRRPGSKAGS